MNPVLVAAVQASLEYGAGQAIRGFFAQMTRFGADHILWIVGAAVGVILLWSYLRK